MKFTEDEKKRFGRLLRRARENKGLSGPKAALALNSEGVEVSQQSLNNWELGKGVPERFEVLIALEEFYGIDGWLLTALGVPNAKPKRERAELRAALDGTDLGGGDTPPGRPSKATERN